MKRFYVFKDGMQQGSMSSKEEAIELIRRRQKRETHPILRSEYSIIEGEKNLSPISLSLNNPRKSGKWSVRQKIFEIQNYLLIRSKLL
ncbi:MAG: hypothetical protein ACLT1K_10865 [[Clostridium] leptum]